MERKKLIVTPEQPLEKSPQLVLFTFVRRDLRVEAEAWLQLKGRRHVTLQYLHRAPRRAAPVACIFYPRFLNFISSPGMRNLNAE